MRTFGGRRAVDGVDLHVRAGQRLAVIGPNGAGKSTLLRLAATLLRPDAGSLLVAGHDCGRHPGRARAAIGYLGHDPLVYLDLTAWQNLELFGDLYGVSGLRERIPAALSGVGLLPRAHEAVRTLSRGMAQRLGLARLMLHDPSVLILDEPYTGLDAQGAALLDGLLAGLGAARAAVIVTHELSRAASVADQIIVLRAGRVVDTIPTAGLDPGALASRYAELTG